jgi:hypothetical protein
MLGHLVPGSSEQLRYSCQRRAWDRGDLFPPAASYPASACATPCGSAPDPLGPPLRGCHDGGSLATLGKPTPLFTGAKSYGYAFNSFPGRKTHPLLLPLPSFYLRSPSVT